MQQTLETKKKIKDTLGRSFKTIRLSLTASCNLACQYCVDEGFQLEKESSLAASQYLDLIDAILAVNEIDTVRLTGGEPLLYGQLAELVGGLKDRNIGRVCLTTNASLLARKVSSLEAAGLDSMNISLDAIDEPVFSKISRRKNLQAVLTGIEAALASKISVKLNSTIVSGVNHNQVLPLLEYAMKRKIPIRYLELMNMGYLHHGGNLKPYTMREILNTIGSRYRYERLPREQSATANYFKLDNDAIFGIIANDSEPFCHDCDRLRIDSLGRVYGCLSSNQPLSLAGISHDNNKVEQMLGQALAQKQTKRFKGSNLSMMQIGG